jgi:hypothetical protein
MFRSSSAGIEVVSAGIEAVSAGIEVVKVHAFGGVDR